LPLSGHGDFHGVVALGSVGAAAAVGRALFWGLERALAVGGPDLEGVGAGCGVPVVDVLAPGVGVELAGEAGVIPGLTVVG